jgi:hypothetical protein
VSTFVYTDIALINGAQSRRGGPMGLITIQACAADAYSKHDRLCVYVSMNKSAECAALRFGWSPVATRLS